MTIRDLERKISNGKTEFTDKYHRDPTRIIVDGVSKYDFLAYEGVIFSPLSPVTAEVIKIILGTINQKLAVEITDDNKGTTFLSDDQNNMLALDINATTTKK